jgi:hypothetical protein
MMQMEKLFCILNLETNISNCIFSYISLGTGEFTGKIHKMEENEVAVSPILSFFAHFLG